MSKSPPPLLPPLELNGIRYEEMRAEQHDDLERRSGYMRARDITKGSVLWEVKVYDVDREEHPLVEMTQDVFFIRFKFMSDKKRILVENEHHQRYLINIISRDVVEATEADFPQEMLYKRNPPREVKPIYYRNLIYKPDYDGIFKDDPRHCGHLKAYDAKTMELIWSEEIYSVPFNHDIENDKQECYFETMQFLPCYRDILISNQVGEQYLFEIRTHKVSKFIGGRLAYAEEKLGLLKRVKYFFQNTWDNLTGMKY